MTTIAITVASDLCEIAVVTRLVRNFATETMESISPPGCATFAMAGNKESLSRYLQKTINA